MDGGAGSEAGRGLLPGEAVLSRLLLDLFLRLLLSLSAEHPCTPRDAANFVRQVSATGRMVQILLYILAVPRDGLDPDVWLEWISIPAETLGDVHLEGAIARVRLRRPGWAAEGLLEHFVSETCPPEDFREEPPFPGFQGFVPIGDLVQLRKELCRAMTCRLRVALDCPLAFLQILCEGTIFGNHIRLPEGLEDLLLLREIRHKAIQPLL